MIQIGIDLGGTNMAFGLVRSDGSILAKKSIPTLAQDGVEQLLARMAEGARTLAAEADIPWEEIASVGIGSPGAVEHAVGRVRSACNLGFQHLMLADAMSARLGKPTHVENDANCAAFAEAVIGAGKGCESCIMLTLGTGIGGGIVLDGKLYRGFNDFGGEFGHTVICHGGEPCACGKYGCLEAYASATALIRDTKRAAEEAPNSLLWQCAKQEGGFTGKTAFSAAAMGDKTAQDVLERYVEMLSVGLANAIKIFQPQIIVIGGGISHAGDALLAPLNRAVMDSTYRYPIEEEKKTKLALATLGNDAGIIGAALLA